jgi:hypothetical protein
MVVEWRLFAHFRMWTGSAHFGIAQVAATHVSERMTLELVRALTLWLSIHFDAHFVEGTITSGLGVRIASSLAWRFLFRSGASRFLDE